MEIRRLYQRRTLYIMVEKNKLFWLVLFQLPRTIPYIDATVSECKFTLKCA